MTATALTRPGQRERWSQKLTEIDWTLCLMLAALAGMGGMLLYSVAPLSWKPWAAPHLVRFGVCFVLMLALSMVSLRVWYFIAYPLYAVSVVLLVAVDLVGRTSLGAQRWLQLGPIGIQPSEFMKIALVLTLARFYHSVSGKTARWSWKLLFPAFLIALPAALIAKQPDLGTALLIAFTGGAVMFLAGLTWKILASGFISAVVGIPPMVMFVLKDYQRERVLTFMNPEDDPSGSGYHILQSKIALGSGGLLGKGFGLGSQSQLNFLPEKHTDFAFSTFAEQFGLVGCLTVLALYCGVIAISLRIAAITHSHFARLAVGGLTATFTFYILVNAAMVMGMAPVVGVPMPLLSYGGTTMVTMMVAFGLVLSARIHRYDEIPAGRGLFF
jgi:rod shape determining protein RodA